MCGLQVIYTFANSKKENEEANDREKKKIAIQKLSKHCLDIQLFLVSLHKIFFFFFLREELSNHTIYYTPHCLREQFNFIEHNEE